MPKGVWPEPAGHWWLGMRSKPLPSLRAHAHAPLSRSDLHAHIPPLRSRTIPPLRIMYLTYIPSSSFRRVVDGWILYLHMYGYLPPGSKYMSAPCKCASQMYMRVCVSVAARRRKPPPPSPRFSSFFSPPSSSSCLVAPLSPPIHPLPLLDICMYRCMYVLVRTGNRATTHPPHTRAHAHTTHAHLLPCKSSSIGVVGCRKGQAWRTGSSPTMRPQSTDAAKI
jgi:hypothetical protein